MLKNAIDYLYAEWNNKAAGFVSYGVVGGARAVEHLRGVLSEVKIAHVRQSVGFSLMTDFENRSRFTPNPRSAALLGTMFDELETWTRALKTVRENPSSRRPLSSTQGARARRTMSEAFAARGAATARGARRADICCFL